ncbi:DUF305 domain-containing protein [Nonomuraea polychroma]|uniref:DUF305 domain-containing protein n=1 Tax=Nonomuraea polychroma TaxID=46176 RepID=UPI003D8E7E4E
MQHRRHVLTILLAALLITGCSTRPPPSVFNATDLAWLQLMIPMNERALELVTLAPGRTEDKRVSELAGQLATSLRGELGALRGLLARSGAPDSRPHAGHDMPGMVTAAGLRSLRGTAGSTFDRSFARFLREHLEQCALISTGATTSGENPELQRLADTIIRSSHAYLKRLDGLTRDPSGRGVNVEGRVGLARIVRAVSGVIRRSRSKMGKRLELATRCRGRMTGCQMLNTPTPPSRAGTSLPWGGSAVTARSGSPAKPSRRGAAREAPRPAARCLHRPRPKTPTRRHPSLARLGSSE